MTSDDQLFNRILQRSLDDLELLHSELDGQSYYAAGVPWFATLFGRDSLITAFQTLSFVPGIEHAPALAGRLGREYDDERDEEPGKVLHELRVGSRPPSARRRSRATTGASTPRRCSSACWASTPTGRATSTCSASCASRNRRARVDRPLRRPGRRRPRRVQAALAARARQSGLEGLLPTASPTTGEPLAAPVALVEVQGYVIRAKRAMARMFELTATVPAPTGCARRRPPSRPRWSASGWPTRAATRSGSTATSAPARVSPPNQGHLLWSNVVSDERARCIRDVLMSDDMFTGWGVRTLAQSHPSYNPVGYHTGSVWPHDSALIAFGLRRYGFDEDFTLIFEGLLEAASRFGDYRLPELFAGFTRAEFDEPVPYPVACQPQAWGGGLDPSVPPQGGLGLSPNALEKRLRVVRPSLPRWLERIDVTGLEVGNARSTSASSWAGIR